jgi:hypothetical protein
MSAADPTLLNYTNITLGLMAFLAVAVVAGAAAVEAVFRAGKTAAPARYPGGAKVE